MGDSSKDYPHEDAPSVIELPISDSSKVDPFEDGPPVIELSILETKIDLEQLNNPWGRQPPRNSQAPPRYNQYQQQGNYQNPNYYQQQAPQQQVGGQNVYYAGGNAQEPVNASRASAYRPASDEPEYHQNSEIFTVSFDSVRIRNRFVQRVYSILAAQLFLTFAFLLLVTYEENLRRFILANWLWLGVLGCLGGAVVYAAIVYIESLRRNFPINLICLGLLTILMTISAAVLVVFVPPVVVLFAIGTTALICFSVSIFACQTKWDVTGCGGCFCVLTIILFLFGLILSILVCSGIYIKLLHIIFSALAVMLFSCWLMYDTQMIVGGRRIEMTPEEYILGALQLYVDIMKIFMNILMLYHLCMDD